MTEIPYHLVIYALSSQWTATRENLHDLVAGELFKRLCVIAYIYIVLHPASIFITLTRQHSCLRMCLQPE